MRSLYSIVSTFEQIVIGTLGVLQSQRRVNKLLTTHIMNATNSQHY